MPVERRKICFPAVRTIAVAAVCCCAALAAGGCGVFGGVSPNLRSVDPAEKIPGMKLAAEKNDRTALPALVAALDSNDPAERLFAIEALQRMTQQTFGYRYYDDDEERAPAVARWKQWLATQPTRR
jgi:hypothetical protein